MKLTEEQVCEAIDIKNLVAAYLNFSEIKEIDPRYEAFAVNVKELKDEVAI